MPLALKVDGIAVSGVDVQAAAIHLRGASAARVLIRNNAGVMSGARVLIKDAPDSVGATIDSTTFASLAEEASKTLRVDGPIEWLELRVDGDVEIDVSILTGIEP